MTLTTETDNPWENAPLTDEVPQLNTTATFLSSSAAVMPGSRSKIDQTYLAPNSSSSTRRRVKSVPKNSMTPISETTSPGRSQKQPTPLPSEFSDGFITPAVINNYCLSCCDPPDTTTDDIYYFRDTPAPPGSLCSMGTIEGTSVWMNTRDRTGLIMSALVWFLLTYSTLTVIFLSRNDGIQPLLSNLFVVLVSLSLACHIKTSLTDPGSVPFNALPLIPPQKSQPFCSRCKSYKPPFSHHCRICNRCVSRMDHHCPWMNNCVGAGNLKFFILFLIYTWTINLYTLLLLGYNYFLCVTEECAFNVVLTQLTRIMTCLSVVFFLFTSSMLMNVIYGIMTGIGTIDRMKKKSSHTMNLSTEEPLLLKDVFGVGPKWQWFLPIDPLFEDAGAVMQWKYPMPGLDN